MFIYFLFIAWLCSTDMHSVSRIGLRGLDHQMIPRPALLLPTAPSGADRSNAKDIFHILRDVTINGTLTFNPSGCCV